VVIPICSKCGESYYHHHHQLDMISILGEEEKMCACLHAHHYHFWST